LGKKHLVLIACVGALVVAPPAAASTQTVVSLTFDDSLATQWSTRSMLTAHGVKATFYANSNNVGTSGHLTWSQLYTLSVEGHEIAGHTLDHVKLTTVTATEVRRQVCQDRAQLLNRGFAVRNFAYPYGSGSSNTTIRTIIQECGYNSARKAWGLYSAATCPTCPPANTIPPPNFYQIETPDNPKQATPLSELQDAVKKAEDNGGGWVPMVFHEICNGCAEYSTSPTILEAFLDWLQQRSAQGTVVRTMDEIVGGPLQPSPGTPDNTPPFTTITCNGNACTAGWYTSPVTVTLATTDATGGSGVEATRYTTDGSDPTLASPVYTGPFTVSATTPLKYRSWDAAGNAEAVRSATLQVDAIAPSVTIIAPGDGARVGGNVKVEAIATDAGSGVLRVVFYVDGQQIAIVGSAPYRFTWNTRKTAKGSHTLTAKAFDRAGNVGTSAVSVTIS
jgi:peptidoglycan/xylan/chitin deacetylase (PgdA/CDA1 family)